MGLVVYFVLAWVVVSVFFFLRVRLEARVNFLLFFAIQIIHINLFTVISLELKYFTYSEKVVDFLAVLVHRDILLPFLLLIFANIWFSLITTAKKILLTGVILLTSVCTEHLFTYFNYIHYHKWSVLHLALYDLGLLIVAILLASGFRKLCMRENKTNGRLSDV